MSYDVSLNFGSEHFSRFGGLRELNGMTAMDSIPILAEAVAALGTEQDEDYWKPTPGNAGHALNVMLGWAKQCPDAVWEIT
mgnify:CR=1 FL=1